MMYTVSVDFGEGEILTYRIFNQTEEQIKTLYEQYKTNTSELSKESFESFMRNENVEFEKFNFDIQLSV